MGRRKRKAKLFEFYASACFHMAEVLSEIEDKAFSEGVNNLIHKSIVNLLALKAGLEQDAREVKYEGWDEKHKRRTKADRKKVEKAARKKGVR